MIELDIKIRAKDQDTVKLFTDLMITGLSAANQMGQVDVLLTAEKDGDKITLVRKEIILPGNSPVIKTPIEDFIAKSNLSIRIRNVLDGTTSWDPDAKKKVPFKFAEDITKTRFIQCSGVREVSWNELEAELNRQKIKY